jgi:tRNA nucleotidyltransferase/poly(A) polymerase
MKSTAWFSEEQLRVLEEIADCSKQASIPVYLVGGVVRDLLLGLDVANADLDLVVDGSAADFADRLAHSTGGRAQHFDRFLTSKVQLPKERAGDNRMLDFASCRKESYQFPGALPSVTLATLAEDMIRRDFRINALYLPVQDSIAATKLEDILGRILGPDGALEDLRQRVVQVFHERSFADDPTRILRAYRYRRRVGGCYALGLKDLMMKAASPRAFSDVEGVRVAGEFTRLLDSQDAYATISEMIVDDVIQNLGILDDAAAVRAAGVLKALSDDSFMGEMQRPILLQVLWICFQQSTNKYYDSETWNALCGVFPKLEKRWARELSSVLSHSADVRSLSPTGIVVRSLFMV